MRIHPEQIGFDIDGVVADTAGAFIRIACAQYGIPPISTEDITDFEVERCLPIAPQVVDEIFTRLMEDPLATGLQPMPHAVEVLQAFARRGPLTFITARPLADPIDEWLRLALGHAAHRKARLIATGAHDGKADHIKAMGLGYFVDDRAQTCMALDLDEAISPIVYTQPWNRGRHCLPSVDDWLAIGKMCDHP